MAFKRILCAVDFSETSLEAFRRTAEIARRVEILKHARDWSADLIVLGAKGATALEQIVVGGTAERVMKDALCSVLIVRGTSRTD